MLLFLIYSVFYTTFVGEMIMIILIVENSYEVVAAASAEMKNKEGGLIKHVRTC